MNILSIGYGRNLFDPNNPEQKRMERCAQEVGSLHMIIFTLKKDGLSEVSTTHGLTIYPTNSASKIHMIFDAIRIGKDVLGTQNTQWVVTAQDPFEAGIAGHSIARPKKLPFNVQIHGEDSFALSFRDPHFFFNMIRRYIARYILSCATTVRVVSKRTKHMVLGLGISEDRLIQLPVRTDAIVPTEVPQDTLKDMYPDASTIVLYMGRLVAVKNLQMLLTAFSELHKKDPRSLLVLAGSGDEQENLKRSAQRLGIAENVAFVAWTDEPFSLMQSADIFALSSNWEGWARVLIEAMSAGTAVVTTDVGCAGEVLIDNEHGFVVPVGDTSAFSQRLIELAGNTKLRERFGAQAQQAVKRIHIPLDTYAHMWGEVFKKTRERYFTSK